MSKLEKYENKFGKPLGFVNEGKFGTIIDKDVASEIGDANISLLDYIFYLSTKKKLSEDKRKLLEYFIKTAGYADPRIWPNRVIGYAANLKNSKYASFSAGFSSLDSQIFGHVPTRKSYSMILKLLKNEQSIEEIINNKGIFYGFGRPNNPIDERVEYYRKNKNKDLYHINFIFSVEEEIQNTYKKNIYLNYSGIGAALALDLNIDIEEFILVNTMTLAYNLIPAYSHMKSRMETGCFLPVRSSDVVYEGDYKIGRKWEDD